MADELRGPRYRQIADWLRDRILDGSFPAGQPLPSEEQLAKRFGVSRPTVRQGISELRAAGLVEVLMGRGMFVRSPQTRPTVTRPRGVRRFADGRYAEADGIRWVLVGDEVPPTRMDAPLALADLLRVPPGEPLFVREVLESAANGQLRQTHRTLVPFSVLAAAGAEDMPASPELFGWFEARGHRLRWNEYVRTRMPLPEEITALRLAEGVPLVQITRVCLNQESCPLALEVFAVPGDDLEILYSYGTDS